MRHRTIGESVTLRGDLDRMAASTRGASARRTVVIGGTPFPSPFDCEATEPDPDECSGCAAIAQAEGR